LIRDCFTRKLRPRNLYSLDRFATATSVPSSHKTDKTPSRGKGKEPCGEQTAEEARRAPVPASRPTPSPTPQSPVTPSFSPRERLIEQPPGRPETEPGGGGRAEVGGGRGGTWQVPLSHAICGGGLESWGSTGGTVVAQGPFDPRGAPLESPSLSLITAAGTVTAVKLSSPTRRRPAKESLGNPPGGAALPPSNWAATRAAITPGAFGQPQGRDCGNHGRRRVLCAVTPPAAQAQRRGRANFVFPEPIFRNCDRPSRGVHGPWRSRAP
jgi:hypothetical protein